MNRPSNSGRFRAVLSLLAGLGCAIALFRPSAALAGGEVGTVAPDFTLNNVLAGPTTVTLSEYAGSVVVLAFFAEW